MYIKFNKFYFIEIKSHPHEKIRAAYCPEVGRSKTGDKFHQMCYTINAQKIASKSCFIPGLNTAFDKGCIPSGSELNPICQFNQNKPCNTRLIYLFGKTHIMECIYTLMWFLPGSKWKKNWNSWKSSWTSNNAKATLMAIVNCSWTIDTWPQNLLFIYMNNIKC